MEIVITFEAHTLKRPLELSISRFLPHEIFKKLTGMVLRHHDRATGQWQWDRENVKKTEISQERYNDGGTERMAE